MRCPQPPPGRTLEVLETAEKPHHRPHANHLETEDDAAGEGQGSLRNSRGHRAAARSLRPATASRFLPFERGSLEMRRPPRTW